MRSPFLVILVLFGATALAGGGFDHNHERWTQWLNRFSQGDQVNYALAHTNLDQLKAYLHQLAEVSKDEFSAFSKEEKVAFWINLYNAATIKLVLDHYPVKSIKDIGSIFESPWKKKIGVYVGQPRTLDEIEHKILRGEFPDYRIHAVLNCASKSCPDLWPTAFTANGLDKQMHDAMKAWINDPEKNRFEGKEQELHVSMIFKWYREDFVRDLGSLENVFEKYLRAEESKPQDLSKFEIKFLDYDWLLNATP